MDGYLFRTGLENGRKHDIRRLGMGFVFYSFPLFVAERMDVFSVFVHFGPFEPVAAIFFVCAFIHVASPIVSRVRFLRAVEYLPRLSPFFMTHLRTPSTPHLQAGVYFGA